jgi:hypothetical protein
MAIRIRVPWIIDLVLVADPAEIRVLDDAAPVDRHLDGRGPLLNRLIVGRMRRWFAIDGRRLPSLLPRGDRERIEHQRLLTEMLDPANGRKWNDVQLDELVAFVRGRRRYDRAAITVQETVGRLFDPAYAADSSSWEAAALVDRFRDGFSPLQIIWHVTGRLRRAFDLLRARSRQDRWAMHATAIGVHGIVHALERMRQLRSLPDAMSFTDEAVLARSLAPPKQVPRVVDETLATPFADEPLRAGTLVMLRLNDAMPRAPDAETIFMSGHWNACPAQAFITTLLKEVWHRSCREDSAFIAGSAA